MPCPVCNPSDEVTAPGDARRFSGGCQKRGLVGDGEPKLLEHESQSHFQNDQRIHASDRDGETDIGHDVLGPKNFLGTKPVSGVTYSKLQSDQTFLIKATELQIGMERIPA